MRRKQRLGPGWLLLPLLAGLPIAVFLAWKEPAPPAPSRTPREIQSGSSESGVVETMPGVDAPEEPMQEVLPAITGAGGETVPVAKGNPDASAVAMPEPPQMEASTDSVSESSPPPEPPPLQNIDWPEIATRPARWPTQTRTKTPVEFPISVGGKRSGVTRVPAGANVKVVKIMEDGVEIAFAEYSTKVALDRTTLGEQLVSNPTVTRPSPHATERSSPPQKVAVPPKMDAPLAPQQNWKSSPGDGRASLVELLKVLDHNSREVKSLDVVEHPEIFKGVTLMMPLRKALTQLGISADIIPLRTPVTHPGIPLYFRAFPCKPSLVGDPVDYFNVLHIVTDAEDRVVGIQFVCESPRSKMSLPKEEFQTYNYILGRRKASVALKVGCEVTPLSDDLLLVESWLFDGRNDKCLEIVRWYLPERIANFLRHVITTRLALAG